MPFSKSHLSIFISSLTGCIRIRILCKHNILNPDFYQEKTHFLPSFSWHSLSTRCRWQEGYKEGLFCPFPQIVLNLMGKMACIACQILLWWGHGQGARPWKHGGWTRLPLPVKVREALIQRWSSSWVIEDIWSFSVGYEVIFSPEKGSRICKSLVERNSLRRSL